jgi:hypothetical protein
MRSYYLTALAVFLLPLVADVTVADGPSHSSPDAVFRVLNYGASVSAADNTAVTQAAIDACAKAGGGIVQFPAGSFRIAGTLKMAANYVWLRGVGRNATTLVFENGGADGIVVGNRIPAKPPVAGGELRGNRISDMCLAHGTKTAGRTVAVINHADFFLEKVTIDHCVVGVYASRINNVVLRDVVIIPDNKGAANQPGTAWSSWVGVWWDTPPDPNDPSARSDILYFDNVCVNCNSAPGTGVLWDGMTNTFLINYANLLNGAYGFRVINSRRNKQYLVPQFLNAFALLIENAKIDLSIETGCEFKITTSDMDMCKENTVQILPDLDGSPTDCVQITNSRIGNCQRTGIVIDAKDVKISNTQMFTTSLAGRSKYPVIEIGSHASNVSITDVRAEEHIGTRNASYAVSIASGASSILIDNLDATHVVVGAVENKGARKLTLGNLIEPDGAAPMRNGPLVAKAGAAYVDSATSFVTPRQGGTIAVAAGTSRVVMTPTTAIASQTLEMPASPLNGQLFYVSAVGQSVSGFKWRGSVIGPPDSISAGHTTIFQFCAVTQKWLCVQK